MIQVRFDTKVLNGFPVEVIAEVEKDGPRHSIYSLEILTQRGKPATFIERKFSILDKLLLEDTVIEKAREEEYYRGYDD